MMIQPSSAKAAPLEEDGGSGDMDNIGSSSSVVYKPPEVAEPAPTEAKFRESTTTTTTTTRRRTIWDSINNVDVALHPLLCVAIQIVKEKIDYWFYQSLLIHVADNQDRTAHKAAKLLRLPGKFYTTTIRQERGSTVATTTTYARLVAKQQQQQQQQQDDNSKNSNIEPPPTERMGIAFDENLVKASTQDARCYENEIEHGDSGYAWLCRYQDRIVTFIALLQESLERVLLGLNDNEDKFDDNNVKRGAKKMIGIFPKPKGKFEMSNNPYFCRLNPRLVEVECQQGLPKAEPQQSFHRKKKKEEEEDPPTTTILSLREIAQHMDRRYHVVVVEDSKSFCKSNDDDKGAAAPADLPTTTHNDDEPQPKRRKSSSSGASPQPLRSCESGLLEVSSSSWLNRVSCLLPEAINNAKEAKVKTRAAYLERISKITETPRDGYDERLSQYYVEHEDLLPTEGNCCVDVKFCNNARQIQDTFSSRQNICVLVKVTNINTTSDIVIPITQLIFGRWGMQMKIPNIKECRIFPLRTLGLSLLPGKSYTFFRVLTMGDEYTSLYTTGYETPGPGDYQAKLSCAGVEFPGIFKFRVVE